MYPPYWKNNWLAIPFNRSLVLGPYEIRGINIPCRFPEGSLLQILGALPNRKVVFFWKTNGCTIWGALKNCSAEPQQVLPRHDLILVNTRMRSFKVPDSATMVIPDKRRGREFLRAIENGQVNTWLSSIKSKYKEVFEEALGTCKTHVV